MNCNLTHIWLTLLFFAFTWGALLGWIFRTLIRR
jgi:hypothetical protein